MASFKAKLFINGEERNLLFVEQEIRKYADITGRPTTKAFPDVLRFAVESTGDDGFFYHNVTSPNNMVEGEIVFYKRDGLSVLFKIEFANSYVLSLHEEFDHNDNLPLHMHLEIGWGIVRYKGVVIEKYWNPSNPFKEVAPIQPQKELEPEVKEIYYTDLQNNRIPENKLKRGMKVYLVLNTLNATGKELTIDLDNNKLDFKYRNEVLEGDMMNVNISADTMKLELKTIAQKN